MTDGDSNQRTIELPYTQGNIFIFPFALTLLLCGGFVIQLGKPLAIALGVLLLLMSGLMFWILITIPRVVSIDCATGTASFIPPPWLKKSRRAPLSIREYTNVYTACRQNGNNYVALSDARGNSTVLLTGIYAEEALRACDLLSRQFGLKNRGQI